MNIAFFDFDGTLTRKDTFGDFAKFALGKWKFYKACLLATPIILKWKLGLTSNSKAKEHLFSKLFRGVSYFTFNQFCQKYSHRINQIIRPEVYSKLIEHQQNNHKTVIVSASISDWIKPWAESIGISDVLATEIEIDTTGKLTGHFKIPNCHGKEKVNRILQHFPDIATHQTWAYGDSKGDDHMLSIVNHPYKV